MSETLTSKTPTNIEIKAHRWRRCPIGKHFVKSHLEHIPPSKIHPQGKTTTRHEHCANNPSHKDELSYDEIQYITETHFSDLKEPLISNGLITLFKTSDNYDKEIRGWTQYWNDIFKPEVPLDPNLVKALIAKGELMDYLVRLSKTQLLNPSANICAGIRWLFQKKKLAKKRLGREPTWIEAIIEYKSYWDNINANKPAEGMDKLHEYYKVLRRQ